MPWPWQDKQRLLKVDFLLVRVLVHLAFHPNLHKMGYIYLYAQPMVFLGHHFMVVFLPLWLTMKISYFPWKPIALIYLVAHTPNFDNTWAIHPPTWPFWVRCPWKSRLEAFVLWGSSCTLPLFSVIGLFPWYTLAIRFRWCSLLRTLSIYLAHPVSFVDQIHLHKHQTIISPQWLMLTCHFFKQNTTANKFILMSWPLFLTTIKLHDHIGNGHSSYINNPPMAKSLAPVCTSKGLLNSTNLSTCGEDNVPLSSPKTWWQSSSTFGIGIFFQQIG